MHPGKLRPGRRNVQLRVPQGVVQEQRRVRRHQRQSHRQRRIRNPAFDAAYGSAADGAERDAVPGRRLAGRGAGHCGVLVEASQGAYRRHRSLRTRTADGPGGWPGMTLSSAGLTIFTTPKRFEGRSNLLQRNPITSWAQLEETPEVLAFGDDEGTPRACTELGVRTVHRISTNEFGRPLISDMFAKAQQLAAHDVLCYVNADVILTSETVIAAGKVSRWSSRFLMV